MREIGVIRVSPGIPQSRRGLHRTWAAGANPVVTGHPGDCIEGLRVDGDACRFPQPLPIGAGKAFFQRGEQTVEAATAFERLGQRIVGEDEIRRRGCVTGLTADHWHWLADGPNQRKRHWVAAGGRIGIVGLIVVVLITGRRFRLITFRLRIRHRKQCACFRQQAVDVICRLPVSIDEQRKRAGLRDVESFWGRCGDRNT